ncbi:hypothetical protein [Streptomyces sp. NPDC006012]|uniref:hypothetical protein n=1 Tax=Streptomyces sp. NPDC006012 TaxID=3364739 RepID=UPI0036C26BE1
MLGLRPAPRVAAATGTTLPEHERPVVFIGPYEHHSYEIPWRESLADVVVVPVETDPAGAVLTD